MSEWKQYRRTGLSEMRPYIVGEDMTGISVSDADKDDPTELSSSGGMVARNPDDHNDRWYVAKQYFKKNLELA